MRPAVLGLAAGLLFGGRGHGLQLFEEPLDLSFVTSGVLLEISLHLLPVSVIFVAIE